MKYIKILFLALLTLCCTNNFASDSVKLTKQEILVNIDAQIKECRQKLQELSHDHANVLKQFDDFAKSLRKTYLSGNGLIHKDITSILDATLFAAQKHRQQVRKDPDQTPYIIHPIGVANYLISIGKVYNADIIIAGLLHDTVEDTQTTFEEIEGKFGNNIANFVREVTDDKTLPKEIRKNLQIEHAPHKSAGAAQIKLADKLYNLIDLAKAPPLDWEKERVDAYFTWATSVVDGLPWVNSSLKIAVDRVIEHYKTKPKLQPDSRQAPHQSYLQ